MDANTHITKLGKLVGNIQSLELGLRACLFEDEVSRGIPYRSPDQAFVAGNLLNANAYTNWDTLGKLIRKYNTLSFAKGLEIEETLVEIRDAIAHGRIFSNNKSFPLNLVRFGNPKDNVGNKVKVEFSVLMTEEWFDMQNSRFYGAIMRVSEVNSKQMPNQT